MACEAEVHISCMQKFAQKWKRSSRRRKRGNRERGLDVCKCGYRGPPNRNLLSTVRCQLAPELRVSTKRCKKLLHTCAKNAFRNFDAFLFLLFLGVLLCLGLSLFLLLLIIFNIASSWVQLVVPQSGAFFFFLVVPSPLAFQFPYLSVGKYILQY